MYNLLLMGVNWTFIYIVYDAGLYPGVNVPLTQILAAPLVFIVALTFTFFAISMPRAGGDFVWVSRTIHPSVGFIESCALVLFVLGWVGIYPPWFLDPGLTGLLVDWGTLTSNPGLINWALGLKTPLNFFIFGTIVVVITMFLNASGTRNNFRFQWGCFAVVIFGTLLWIGVMLSAGHAGFVARFNQISGLNYDNVIHTAQAAGYNTGFTATGTILGLVYAFLIYYGFAWSAYFAGEMKEAYRSQVVAIVGSVIIFAFLTWVPYQVAYTVAGQEFVHASSYLWISGNSAWSLPFPPFMNYLVVFATDNPWIAAIVALSIIAEVFGTIATYWIMITRVIFAWSFDRLIPTVFSEVDQRFHAPRNALILTFVIGMVYLYIGTETTLLTYITYSTMGVWLATGITGIAAFVFPYRRKDIFEKAPKLAKVMVGNVPLMAICGLATAIIGFAAGIFSAIPEFTGAPVNPYYVLVVILTFVFAGVYSNSLEPELTKQQFIEKGSDIIIPSVNDLPDIFRRIKVVKMSKNIKFY
jgi:amino acid transporter